MFLFGLYNKNIEIKFCTMISTCRNDSSNTAPQRNNHQNSCQHDRNKVNTQSNLEDNIIHKNNNIRINHHYLKLGLQQVAKSFGGGATSSKPIAHFFHITTNDVFIDGDTTNIQQQQQRQCPQQSSCYMYLIRSNPTIYLKNNNRIDIPTDNKECYDDNDLFCDNDNDHNNHIEEKYFEGANCMFMTYPIVKCNNDSQSETVEKDKEIYIGSNMLSHVFVHPSVKYTCSFCGRKFYMFEDDSSDSARHISERITTSSNKTRINFKQQHRARRNKRQNRNNRSSLSSRNHFPMMINTSMRHLIPKCNNCSSSSSSINYATDTTPIKNDSSSSIHSINNTHEASLMSFSNLLNNVLY